MGSSSSKTITITTINKQKTIDDHRKLVLGIGNTIGADEQGLKMIEKMPVKEIETASSMEIGHILWPHGGWATDNAGAGIIWICDAGEKQNLMHLWTFSGMPAVMVDAHAAAHAKMQGGEDCSVGDEVNTVLKNRGITFVTPTQIDKSQINIMNAATDMGVGDVLGRVGKVLNSLCGLQSGTGMNVLVGKLLLDLVPQFAGQQLKDTETYHGNRCVSSHTSGRDAKSQVFRLVLGSNEADTSGGWFGTVDIQLTASVTMDRAWQAASWTRSATSTVREEAKFSAKVAVHKWSLGDTRPPKMTNADFDKALNKLTFALDRGVLTADNYELKKAELTDRYLS